MASYPTMNRTWRRAAVAHGEALLAQLLHDRPDDAGTGEDDFRPLRLQTDDGAAGLRIPRPVELDLAVDLGTVEDGPLDDGGIIRGEAIPDRGDIGHRAAHRDQRVGNRAPVDAREICRNRRHGLAQHVRRHGSVQPVALGSESSAMQPPTV